MTNIRTLMTTKQPFLTDGGFETWMFFIEEFEAPEFAAIILMDDARARKKMQDYFERFLQIAERAGTGFVLDTNTWRGCLQWADKLNRSEVDMLRLTKQAVEFAQGIRDDWRSRVSPILINGVVGPVGDGYNAANAPTEDESRQAHQPQIDLFAETGVDMVSAITMTNVPEAVGIIHAATKHQLATVISFTVEIDGTLPTGQSLESAIKETDKRTGSAPLYYMINCAHPDHFRGTVNGKKPWTKRIGGIRANASRMSHAELDNSKTLDDGNPEEFGLQYLNLAATLPSLRVIGGCCGTDHRHVECVSRQIHA